MFRVAEGQQGRQDKNPSTENHERLRASVFEVWRPSQKFCSAETGDLDKSVLDALGPGNKKSSLRRGLRERRPLGDTRTLRNGPYKLRYRPPHVGDNIKSASQKGLYRLQKKRSRPSPSNCDLAMSRMRPIMFLP